MQDEAAGNVSKRKTKLIASTSTVLLPHMCMPHLRSSVHTSTFHPLLAYNYLCYVCLIGIFISQTIQRLCTLASDCFLYLLFFLYSFVFITMVDRKIKTKVALKLGEGIDA